MRFRFCGDLDCPDWVLAEIATLSKLTSVKMKLFSVQVMKELIGAANMDYGKIEKLTADAKYDLGDMKASIAALSFIFTSAAKHHVTPDDLSNELQQLGLPKEHSTAVCKVYEDNNNELRRQLIEKSLRVNFLESTKWRVDLVLSSSKIQEVMEPQIHVQLKVKENDVTKPVAFTLSHEKLTILLSELQQAQDVMKSLTEAQ